VATPVEDSFVIEGATRLLALLPINKRRKQTKGKVQQLGEGGIVEPEPFPIPPKKQLPFKTPYFFIFFFLSYSGNR